jgi:hypothetical protein
MPRWFLAWRRSRPWKLFCKSEEAIETFIRHCDVAARDLLMPYGDVVIALSTVPPNSDIGLSLHVAGVLN